VRWWDGAAWGEYWTLPPPDASSRVDGPVFPASPGPYGTRGTIFAAYGARVGGYLLDWLIVAVVATPLAIVFSGFRHRFTETTIINGQTTYLHGTTWGFGWQAIVIHASLVLLYCTLMCGSSRGQTLGMMAVGARVTTVSGARLGYAKAFLRTLVEYLFAVVFFLPWILDMLFPLWDTMRQTLHDKVVGSVVVAAGAEATLTAA
jgi:uncharacterized RDD family membrane protein YckC